MNYESAPNGVSHDALLRVVEGRSTIGKPYEERLYIVELTNTLVDLAKRTKISVDHRRTCWDPGADWDNSQA